MVTTSMRLPVTYGTVALNPGLRTYSRQTPDASLEIMMAKGVEAGHVGWIVTHIYDRQDYDTKEFHITEEGDAFLYFLSAVQFWEARADFTFRLLIRAEKERVQRLFWAVSHRVRARSARPIRAREGQ